MKRDPYTRKYIIFQTISTDMIRPFPERNIFSIILGLIIGGGAFMVGMGLVMVIGENPANTEITEITFGFGIGSFLFILGTIISVLSCYKEQLIVDPSTRMVEYMKRSLFSRISWCKAFDDIKEIYLQGYNAKFRDESEVYYVKKWRVICKLTNNQNLTIYDAVRVVFMSEYRTGETEAGSVAKDLAQLIGREVVKKDYVRI